MRTLEFVADGQTLKKDQSCDFTGLVAGSRGYLQARFAFTKEWTGCKKVAVFTCKGQQYPVGLVNNMCEIPAEALTGRLVMVHVIGRRAGYEIETSVCAFPQTLRR